VQFTALRPLKVHDIFHVFLFNTKITDHTLTVLRLQLAEFCSLKVVIYSFLSDLCVKVNDNSRVHVVFAICYSAYMLSPVRLSVCQMGRS